MLLAKICKDISLSASEIMLFWLDSIELWGFVEACGVIEIPGLSQQSPISADDLCNIRR